MNVGSSQTATIGTANGIGLVVFDGTAGHRVSVQVSGVTIGTSTCCSTSLSISNPDGSTLVAQTFVGTSGGFLDAAQLPASGTATIAILPQNGATGSLTLQLNDVPADAAASITPGGAAATVTTTAAGQNAQLTVAGAAGQRVSLQLTGVTIGPSTCCSTLVSLKKPDGSTLVAPAYVGTNGGFIDAATLPATGTYTILVDPQGTPTGSATLTVYDVPADASATTSPGGSAVTLSLATPGQNGQVNFSGSASQRVSLALSGVTVTGPSGPASCCSSQVSLLKPDGTALVAPAYIGTTGGFIDATTLPVAGTYTILVDPQGADVGNLTLQLYDVPADASGTVTIGGAGATVSMSVPGQNARLSLSGTAGQTVSLSFAGVTVSGSTGPVSC